MKTQRGAATGYTVGGKLDAQLLQELQINGAGKGVAVAPVRVVTKPYKILGGANVNYRQSQ